MNLTVSPIKINILVQKHNQKTATKQNLHNDVFVKNQPNFTNNTLSTQGELEENIRNSIYVGNSENLLALYRQNPEAVEQFFMFSQKLKQFEDEKIDKIFGFKKGGKSLRIYDDHYQGIRASISLLNRTLLLNTHKNVLSPLLSEIAQKKPAIFRKEHIISMYANDRCEEAISILAQNDSESVFSALEQSIYDYDSGNFKKHLAIENLKITPQRQKVFETLFEIDPLRTSYIISALPPERRKEFEFDESKGDADVKAILDVINSKDDVLEVNKKLLDLYDKSPESITKSLLSPCQKTGELYVNSMMKDKNRNYYGIMLYLLLKNPNEFFEIAEKSDFMWHAANNKKQSYLELFEQALFIDSEKTKEILTKPSENRLIYPRTTPAMECVDNKSFDYTELFKAFYQEDIKSAFLLFASNAGGTNLLTYYVNQKGYKAEDFISYLTNQNLRFAKSLLSAETLTRIKDLRYKTAMANLNRAKKELENEFGRQLSETEERVMRRIAGVEKEMREEIKAVNGRMDGLLGYADRLGKEVYKHIYPPSAVGSNDGFIPSALFESASSINPEKYDPLLTWHFAPLKPYGPGVI